MDTPVKTPSIIIISQTLLGLCAFFFILYIGQQIILPLIYATIIAILLNPFVNFLCHRGMNRVVAIFIAILISMIVVGGLFYFIFSQATMFSETFPQLRDKFNDFLLQTVEWVSDTFDVSTAKINAWIAKTKAEGMSNSGTVVGQTLLTVTNLVVLSLLLPVYTFMILFYKPLLLDFIGKLFNKETHSTLAEILFETKLLIQNYLVGLLIEAAIVATLNSVGLIILGIQYAVLLGIIGALLNIIPYIGGVIAISLPVMIALATKEPIYALFVLILYIIVQFIDNNFIVPKIVASRVKINALVSIVVVLIGGALWGVPGMFLAIPLTAIVKVIFDRIEPLQPWGFLLGDTMPPIGKSIFKFARKKIKK